MCGKKLIKSGSNNGIKRTMRDSYIDIDNGRPLYSIQNTQEKNQAGTVRRGGGIKRKEAVITRLRTGYTKLKRTLYMIGRHPSGLCNSCQKQKTE